MAIRRALAVFLGWALCSSDVNSWALFSQGRSTGSARRILAWEAVWPWLGCLSSLSCFPETVFDMYTSENELCQDGGDNFQQAWRWRVWLLQDGLLIRMQHILWQALPVCRSIWFSSLMKWIPTLSHFTDEEFGAQRTHEDILTVSGGKNGRGGILCLTFSPGFQPKIFLPLLGLTCSNISVHGGSPLQLLSQGWKCQWASEEDRLAGWEFVLGIARLCCDKRYHRTVQVHWLNKH